MQAIIPEISSYPEYDEDDSIDFVDPTKEYPCCGRLSTGFSLLQWNIHLASCSHPLVTIDRIKQIIQNDPSTVNYQNSNENTALMMASQHASLPMLLEIMQELIRAGADPNLFNNIGNTALKIASMFAGTTSSVSAINLLLDAGADIELVHDQNKSTALLFACLDSGTNSSLEAVRTLINRGANVNFKDSWGDSILSILVGACYSPIVFETISLLIESGADVNAQNDDGIYPLYIAVCEYKKKSNLQVIDLLLRSGANPNLKIKTGDNALVASLRTCSLKITRLLVEHGADVHNRNNIGANVLMLEFIFPVCPFSFDITWYLINSNIDLNIQCSNGDTVLLILSQSDLPHYIFDIYRELIKRGANPYIKNDNGMNAMPIVTKYPDLTRLVHNRVINASIKERLTINEIDSDNICSICGDPEDTSYVILQCGHQFHTKCAIRWLKKEGECPYCRGHFY